ncbi:MAG TPA: hypothetical protein VLC55_14730, partial [Burkholderiales bacterium]|nr:hypothetical protein [Burkholderiales bacterium]
MKLSLPTVRACYWLGAAALVLSACAAPREPGPPPLPADHLRGQSPTRALYRDGTFYLEFPGSGDPVMLAARWPVEDLRPDQHNYRVAQLDVLEDSGGGRAGAPRDAQPVRLLDRSQWDDLVDSLPREIAPATDAEAALVTVQGREIVVHRTADGTLRVHLHEQK